MEKSFPFELKALTEKGAFEGLASTYGNTDAGGDVVVPGAFARTLKERGDTRPVLWSHDVTAPVGLGKLTDTAGGLMIRGDLDLDSQAGRETYSRLKKKIITGLSIGYNTVLDKMEGGVRRLLDVELFEVSLVLFPMNDQARVATVKSGVQTIREFEAFLHRAGWSKTEACKLASHGWPGLASDAGEADLAAWLQARIRAA